MNPETITIEDCIDMHEKKGQAVIIENGRVIGFTKEKPVGAATPNRPITKHS